MKRAKIINPALCSQRVIKPNCCLLKILTRPQQSRGVLSKCRIKLKKGFSIGEVMLSVFILLVALISAIQLIAASIRESIGSRDYVIASELAQEGVEIARNVRDNSWIASPSEPSFLDFHPGDANNCRVDKNSADVQFCNNNPGGKKLYYFGGSYVHNAAGSATKFQRKIILDYDATGNILTVYSVVVWGSFMPADVAALNACAVSSRCVYAQLILTKWGE